MSWDSYLENLVARTKDTRGKSHCDKACIIGIDGGAPWTSPTHPLAFKLNGAESVHIAKSFKTKDFTTFIQAGIRCDGINYTFLRVDDDKIVYGKYKEHGTISLQATKESVIIGHCPEGSQPGFLNKGVAFIAEYLVSMDM